MILYTYGFVRFLLLLVFRPAGRRIKKKEKNTRPQPVFFFITINTTYYSFLRLICYVEITKKKIHYFNNSPITYITMRLFNDRDAPSINTEFSVLFLIIFIINPSVQYENISE